MAKYFNVRALVVDDCEKWRHLVHTTLQAKFGIQRIEEAANGVEGVQKAEDLQPDLAVLDIGLPGLNGIEVARRLRNISPRTRIIFLTQNRSRDVAEAALETGAWAYVLKAAFSKELIPAVEAAIEGRQFQATLHAVPATG